MNDTRALLEADRRRREAMISADMRALSDLLSDELIWTHSSGRTDGKASFLEKIESGATVYHELEVDDAVIVPLGDVYVHHGTLTGSATAAGKRKDLRNRFLSVWKTENGNFEMLAWQSTGF